jgi:hypothetical protein
MIHFRLRHPILLSGCVAAGLFFAPGAGAQEVAVAQVEGQVVGASGAAVPNAALRRNLMGPAF